MKYGSWFHRDVNKMLLNITDWNNFLGKSLSPKRPTAQSNGRITDTVQGGAEKNKKVE